MLILGTLFGVTDEACLLAAVVASPRRVFVCPPGKKKESLACVRGFSVTSDVLAAYRAVKYYELWKQTRSEGFADRWASELFLVPKRMKSLLAAREMHREELKRAGLLPTNRVEDHWAKDNRGRNVAGWDGVTEAHEAWDETYHVHTLNVNEVESSLTGAQAALGGEEMEFVKALLVAAYPQNIALRRRVNLAKHQTSTGLDAIIAPQSVNAAPKGKAERIAAPRSEERLSSWWSYGQMHLSNRQGFLRATTLVDPYHIALFGGLTTSEGSGGMLREIDGWIELRGQRATLRAMKRFRDAISRCINLRTLDPGARLPNGARNTLAEICTLLRSAAARQERIISCLPESFACPVERPLPAPLKDGRQASGMQRQNNNGYAQVWETWEGAQWSGYDDWGNRHHGRSCPDSDGSQWWSSANWHSSVEDDRYTAVGSSGATRGSFTTWEGVCDEGCSCANGAGNTIVDLHRSVLRADASPFCTDTPLCNPFHMDAMSSHVGVPQIRTDTASPQGSRPGTLHADAAYFQPSAGMLSSGYHSACMPNTCDGTDGGWFGWDGQPATTSAWGPSGRLDEPNTSAQY